MSEGHPPIRAHPGKPFRSLRDAAQSGHVVELWCTLCRRRATFLAHDLLRVCAPDYPLHVPPFGCGRCATAGHVAVNVRTPTKGNTIA